MAASKAINVFKWTTIANLSQYIISFALSVVLARILTPTEYGLTATIAIFIVLSKTFIDAGLSIPVVQRNDINNNDLSTVFWFNLFVSISIYVLLFFFAPFIAAFFREPILIPITRLIGLNLVFNSAGIIQNALLIKDLYLKKQAVLNLVGLSLSVVVAIWMALNNYGVYSIVGQILTNSIALNLLLWTTSKWRPLYIFDKKSFLKLWSLGSKVLITNIITNLIGSIDDFIIGKVYSINRLGLYSRAKSLVNVLNSIYVGSLNSLAFSLLSKNNEDINEFVRLHKKIFSHSFFLLIIITLLISSNSEAIIISLYSEKWRASVEILKVMIFMLFPIFTNAFSSQTLLALGDGSLYLKLFLVKKVFIFLVLSAVYLFDLQTFVYCFVGVNLINCLIDFYVLSTRLQIKFKFYFSDFKIIIPITIITFGTNNLFSNLFPEKYFLIMFASLFTGSTLAVLFLELFKPSNYVSVKKIFLSQMRNILIKS